MTYDNINSHKKTGLHPLSRRYILLRVNLVNRDINKQINIQITKVYQQIL